MDEYGTESGQVADSGCMPGMSCKVEPELTTMAEVIPSQLEGMPGDNLTTPQVPSSVIEAEATVEIAQVVRIPWWPMVLYGSAWAALTTATVWSLTRTTDVPSVQQKEYPLILAAGFVLTLLGPALAAAVWAVVWSEAQPTERGGLFTTSLLRAAAFTLSGVVTWWASLVLIDIWRSGRL